MLKEDCLRSLAPSSYQVLPKLEAPAGYICVLRDVDSDCYRIDKTNHPTAFMDQVLAERALDFGIELVSIVQSNNLDEIESYLHLTHHAALGNQWLDLDRYQLRELRNSVLQINAYHSCYLSAKNHGEQAKLTDAKIEAPRSPDAILQARGNGRRLARRTLDLGQGRARSQRRLTGRLTSWNDRPRMAQGNNRRRLDDLVNDLIVRHPKLVLAVLAIILLIALSQLDHDVRYPIAIR